MRRRAKLHGLIAAVLGTVLACGNLSAQTEPERLPPVIPPESSFHRGVSALPTAMIPPSADGPSYLPDELVKPESAGETWLEEPGVPIESDPRAPSPPPSIPRGAKSGVWQSSTPLWTWLGSGGAEGLGMFDASVHSMFAVPLGSRETPLLISPLFTAHFLDGPATVDLPPRLYDATLEFRVLRQLTPRWGMDLAVAPGYFTDFENNSSDSFRVTGRAIGVWDWTPTTKLALGVVYLGRDDVTVLPAFGVICSPSETTRIELIMPRPRFAQRFAYYGDVEHWWYAAGEFGGNTWAIERNGLDDKVTYSDLRAVVGVERKAPGEFNTRWEVGYVFAREIEFSSGRPGLDPDDTFMVRAELSF